jgi:hypothetical protein
VLALLARSERIELEPPLVPGIDHGGQALGIRARRGGRSRRIAAAGSIPATAATRGNREQSGEQETASIDPHVPSAPRFDPAVDLAFEDLHRHRAIAQDFAVEVTDVELRAQRRLALRRKAWMRRSPTL